MSTINLPVVLITNYRMSATLKSTWWVNLGQNFGMFLYSRYVILASVDGEHPIRITNCEIIFEEWQPTGMWLWSRHLNVTDRQTDRRIDNLP